MTMSVPQMVFLPLFVQHFRVQFYLFLRESRGQSGQCAQELSLSDHALKETLLPAPSFRHRTLRPKGVNCSTSVPAASWHVSGQQPRALVHMRTRRNRTWRRCPGHWEWRGRISPHYRASATAKQLWDYTEDGNFTSHLLCGLGRRGSHSLACSKSDTLLICEIFFSVLLYLGL